VYLPAGGTVSVNNAGTISGLHGIRAVTNSVSLAVVNDGEIHGADYAIWLNNSGSTITSLTNTQ
jgi:hypothetical protein